MQKFLDWSVHGQLYVPLDLGKQDRAKALMMMLWFSNMATSEEKALVGPTAKGEKGVEEGVKQRVAKTLENLIVQRLAEAFKAVGPIPDTLRPSSGKPFWVGNVEFRAKELKHKGVVLDPSHFSTWRRNLPAKIPPASVERAGWRRSPAKEKRPSAKEKSLAGIDADVNQRLTPPAKRSATNNRVPPGFATGGADGEPHKPNKPIVVLSQPKSTIKPMQLNTDRVIAKAATTPFDMGINALLED